jgi:hypothetical protein
MQLSAMQTKLVLGLIGLVVALLVCFIWARRAPRAAPVQTQAPGAASGQAVNAPRSDLPSGITLPQRGTPSNSMPFTNEQFRRMMSSRKTGP